MTTYTYDRTCVSNCYKIDNPERVDLESKPIHIAKEIEAVFTGKNFLVRCNGLDCNIIFEEALIQVDKDKLDVIVSKHINNTQT